MKAEKDGHVCLPLAQYLDLLQAAKEYAHLRTALYQGGVTPQTIDTLLRGERKDDLEDEEPLDPSLIAEKRPSRVYAELHQPFQPSLHARNEHRQEMESHAYDAQAVDDFPSTHLKSWLGSTSADGADFHIYRDARTPSPFQELNKRTLYFAGLPPSTTLQDIIDVVRGGIVLDLQLANGHARVTMFESGQAEQYLRHVKRHDLYINLKRVCSFDIEFFPSLLTLPSG